MYRWAIWRIACTSAPPAPLPAEFGKAAKVPSVMLPAGSHAIDVLKGDIELKFATGQEEFIPFGTNDLEHPLPGEVVFVERDQVLTRRWTWRQANHTLTLPDSTAVEFNVDGLPPVTREEVEQACKEVADLVSCYCGGTSRIDYLTAETPTVSLEP